MMKYIYNKGLVDVMVLYLTQKFGGIAMTEVLYIDHGRGSTQLMGIHGGRGSIFILSCQVTIER